MYPYWISYASAGAPTGQVPAHAPQEIHSSALISYLPSPSEIALTGHSASQAPQEIHSSLIWYAIILNLQLIIDVTTCLSYY